MQVFDKAHTNLVGFSLHSSGYKTSDEAYRKGKAIDKRNNGVSFKIVRYNDIYMGIRYQLYIESLYYF